MLGRKMHHRKKVYKSVFVEGVGESRHYFQVQKEDWTIRVPKVKWVVIGPLNEFYPLIH